MKTKLGILAIILTFAVTFVPTFSSNAFGQDNDRDRDRRTSRSRQEGDRDRDRDRDRIRRRHRRTISTNFRNFGQFRRTQVGNRRFNHDNRRNRHRRHRRDNDERDHR